MQSAYACRNVVCMSNARGVYFFFYLHKRRHTDTFDMCIHTHSLPEAGIQGCSELRSGDVSTLPPHYEAREMRPRNAETLQLLTSADQSVRFTHVVGTLCATFEAGYQRSAVSENLLVLGLHCTPNEASVHV